MPATATSFSCTTLTPQASRRALRAIDALTPQGYRFVTLEELFRQKGVEPEPGKLYIRPDELKRIA